MDQKSNCWGTFGIMDDMTNVGSKGEGGGRLEGQDPPPPPLSPVGPPNFRPKS